MTDEEYAQAEFLLKKVTLAVLPKNPGLHSKDVLLILELLLKKYLEDGEITE